MTGDAPKEAVGKFTATDPAGVTLCATCTGTAVAAIDGKVIGNDDVNDQKIYAIKTTEKDYNGIAGAGLSRKDQKDTVGFIKTNSGNAEVFKK